MIKICGVYLIKNNLNGKCYVGSSSNIMKRWNEHKRLSTWEKYNNDLYKDFQEYGLDNFSFEVLEKCDESELFQRERYYIETLGTIVNGYNKMIPFRPKEEAKAKYKIYKDKYNKEHSKEHTLNMRIYRKKSA